MAEETDWTFVAEVLGGRAEATAFFVSPSLAVTVAEALPYSGEAIPDPGPVQLRCAGTDEEVPARVIGSAWGLGVLSCSGPSFKAWTTSPSVGTKWESLSFVGSGNMPFWVFSGDVDGRMGDQLALRYDSPVNRMTSILAGAPILVDGGVAGVLLGGARFGRLYGFHSDFVRAALARWLNSS